MKAKLRHIVSDFICSCVEVGMMLLAVGCFPVRKLNSMRTDNASACLALPPSSSSISTASLDTMMVKRDTVRVVDVDGREMFLMSAIKDDDGNMVANQVLDAAVVVARFRNVAERNGRVDLRFQIIVPQALHDRNWQLRYSPTMFIMGDSLSLDKVIITGEQYRRRQLRGYQQYQRFLDSIVADTSRFVDLKALEIFLRRNIPQVYAYRCDTSYVDDETFASAFGVSQKQAIEHYTNHLAEYFNNLRKGRVDKMYRRYVKSPIISDGIRLDTVIRDLSGNYIYDYVQPVQTRARLRKVDIVLDGQVYQQNTLLHTIPRSEPLTFFISSLSALVDGTERYMTRIVERQVKVEQSYDVSFELGKSDINPSLADNSRQIARIKRQLDMLIADKIFDLDSVVIVASCSPEGRYASNETLSRARSRSISDYFERYARAKSDSVRREEGVVISLDDTWTPSASRREHIGFLARPVAEDWDYLYSLVERDTVLSVTGKEEILAYADVADPDARERLMQKEPWYAHLRCNLYPRLRSVHFQFALSRKGMQKDTVYTTVLDSVYMAGVHAIRERDYEKAAQLLAPYADYNTAVAYLALDRNLSALAILDGCRDTPARQYMMAIAYSRLGREQEALQCYINSCSADRQFIHRGNLDPEISSLIRKYNLEFNQ